MKVRNLELQMGKKEEAERKKGKEIEKMEGLKMIYDRIKIFSRFIDTRTFPDVLQRSSQL
jgi:hypothetical protein